MATYNTMQRTSILSFLETNIGQAFTVKEIVDGIRSDNAASCSPSESTVYRIMSDLVKNGIVRRKINQNREYQYRLSNVKSGSISIRCKVCGAVQHIDEKVCSEIIDELKNSALIGTDGDIEILGICDKCK
ncbi:MAG: transcriptional repressor [Ruminococcus sp.]|uniref:transcriptional repressor n=1 Tax=Ruminococcus sp. TaxID=41978 RepID=UPI0025E46399|nr:transcriptional repressor [Ruminococcus sp.]MCR4795001.1 transcriptional repressor [Ruminococcus sp.]